MSAPPAAAPTTRIGVDTGGTFTDCVSFDRRGLVVHKLRSTPDDPSRAIVDGVRALSGAGPTPDLVHGSTVATNAVLERRGRAAALVTTAGFEDCSDRPPDPARPVRPLRRARRAARRPRPDVRRGRADRCPTAP